MTIENKIGGREGAAHEILMFPWCRVWRFPQQGTLGAQGPWLPGTVVSPGPSLAALQDSVSWAECEEGLETRTSRASLHAVLSCTPATGRTEPDSP